MAGKSLDFDWMIGRRIRLIKMPKDPAPIEPGAEGVVTDVNDFDGWRAQVSVKWDNGRTLMLITGVDSWEVLDDQGAVESQEPKTCPRCGAPSWAPCNHAG